MHSITDINAIISQAKQQRADYIGTKVQKAALPVMLVGMLSLALAQFAGEPSQDQAQRSQVADASAQNG